MTSEQWSDLAWSQMVLSQPRFAQLVVDCSRVVDNGTGSFCRHKVWCFGYGALPSIRKTLTDLLLNYQPAPNDLADNPAAFHITMNKALDQLPECRMCTCVVPGGWFLQDVQRLEAEAAAGS
jgi:hypothetical protein